MQAILSETAEHWGRMIAWAERQWQDNIPSQRNMMISIGEAWGAHDCACYRHNNVYGYCPLRKSRCVGSCVNEWNDVNHAETWYAWVIVAKIMLGRIKA